jgi:integrase/recombinase XerD
VRTQKSSENPFRFMAKGNVELDGRHVRRAVTADEFSRLLAAAQKGSSYRGLVGSDRAMLYLVAGTTGLRASELASLTTASFSLDADTPTVTVEAAYSKHRRRDEVPLHPGLITELRPWLGTKTTDTPLWGGKWAKQFSAAAMIRRDLDAARAAWIGEAVSGKEKEQREKSEFLKYRDDCGEVVDFHALRHTFVTNLVNAGVMPKDAKELARHSTITLTMDRYAHVGIRDIVAAVAKLTVPITYSTAESALLKATGTDGKGDSDVPPDVPAT